MRNFFVGKMLSFGLRLLRPVRLTFGIDSVKKEGSTQKAPNGYKRRNRTVPAQLADIMRPTDGAVAFHL